MSIKRNHRELGKLGKVVQFRVECCEHPIIHRTGLVDGNSDLCLTADALAGMNLWEPLVETTRSRPLVSTLGSAYKVTQHLFPVYFCSEALFDCLSHTLRNRAPVARLVRFLGSLADRLLETLGSNLTSLTTALGIAETIVDIEGILIAKGVAFAVLLGFFLHLFQLGKIPLVSLPSRKISKLALTGQNTLHWLTTLGEHRTGISLTGQLSSHFGKTID